jgi:hypothetical protein
LRDKRRKSLEDLLLRGCLRSRHESIYGIENHPLTQGRNHTRQIRSYRHCINHAAGPCMTFCIRQLLKYVIDVIGEFKRYPKFSGEPLMRIDATQSTRCLRLPADCVERMQRAANRASFPALRESQRRVAVMPTFDGVGRLVLSDLSEEITLQRTTVVKGA